MLASSILKLLAIYASAASAAATQYAIVVIEASHGGAGNGLTNTTIHVPLSKAYTNNNTLAEVSTLFLTGAQGVPANTITCTPFKTAQGTGDAGLPFNSTSPSYISTNTVQLGSIVCITTNIQFAPTPIGPATASSNNFTHTNKPTVHTSPYTSSYTSPYTSTILTSVTGPGGRPHQSTITSLVSAPATPTSPAATGSASGSASASLSSGNAANSLFSPSEVFGLLALAGFGLAFAL